MKTTPSRLLFLCALSAGLAVHPVRAAIEVSAELTQNREKPDKSKDAKDGAAEGDAPAGDKKPAAPKPAGGGGAGAPKPMNQDKALKVTIRNVGSKAEAGTTVRYWMMGRDMKTMKPTVLGGGESSVNLTPNGTETVISEPVKSTFTTRQVFVASPAAGGKAGAAKPPAGGAGGAGGGKPAEASGVKIIGYGVQVIKDGKVVSESFTEPSFKTVVGSDGTKPGEAYKPKEKGGGDK